MLKAVALFVVSLTCSGCCSSSRSCKDNTGVAVAGAVAMGMFAGILEGAAAAAEHKTHDAPSYPASEPVADEDDAELVEGIPRDPCDSAVCEESWYD